MEPTSRGRPRAGLLCVAVLSATLAVPGLALAAAHAPRDATPADARTTTGDRGEPEGPGCQPLVVHRPGAPSEGDERTVAITSQVLAAGDPAWERVGWQAARGVTVALVTVEREDGPETLEGEDLGRGTAEDVLRIAFCGERERPRDTEPTVAEEPLLSLVTTERSAAPSDEEGSGGPAAKTLIAGALLGLLAGGVILGPRRFPGTSR